MSQAGLSSIPLEARRYQGRAAGVATRIAANIVDAFVVGTTMVAAYAGYIALRLLISAGRFRLPDPSLQGTVLAFLGSLVVYLTAAWWITGRTFGDHVMGLRVVGGRGARLRLTRAFARALLCAGFPVGLLWCALSPRRRSVQDLLLRTSVVYDWVPTSRTWGTATSQRTLPTSAGSSASADPTRHAV